MREAVKRDFGTYISEDIPPQMKILNVVIPILMHFCSFVSNLSNESCKKPHIIQQYVTSTISDMSQTFDLIQSVVQLQNQVH